MSKNYRLARQITSGLVGVPLGALILGSNLPTLWAVIGAMLGGIAGAWVGPRVGAWMDEARARGGFHDYHGGGPASG